MVEVEASTINIDIELPRAFDELLRSGKAGLRWQQVAEFVTAAVSSQREQALARIKQADD